MARTDSDFADDVTVQGTLGAGTGPRLSTDDVLPRGASVGRYLVLQCIGVGGMGVVYLALDPDLGRKVALKLVRGEARVEGTDGIDATPRSTGGIRLLREAQAMARLRHANVITVYDVGTRGQDVFIAMEYLDGGTLRQWLEAAPRTLAKILGVFREAAAGLAAAHAGGLVHRDFKPDNVLLGTDGRVCVVDFGISRAADEAELTEVSGGGIAVDELRLTRTGAMIGTPAYMAPEQHAGRVADARSDQFALCVALYEALYRQRPFAGETQAHLAANVIEGNLRRPPEGHGVPAWLWPVVARGLAVDPSRRYADVAALLAALGDDPARRRRRWWYAGVAVGLTAGAALGVAALVRRQEGLCSGAAASFAEIWNDDARARGEQAFSASGRAHAPQAWTEAEAALDTTAHAWIDSHTEACRATTLRGEQSQALLDRRMVCLERRRAEVASVIDVLVTADAGVVDHTGELLGQIGDVDGCNDAAVLLADETSAPSDPAEAAAIRAEIARARALRIAARDQAVADITDALHARVDHLDDAAVRAEWLHLHATVRSDHGDTAAATPALYEAAKLAAASHHTALEPAIWLSLVRLVGALEDRPLELPPLVEAASVAVVRAGDHPADRGALATVVGMQALMRGQFGDGEQQLRSAVALLTQVHGADGLDTLEARELLALCLHGQQRYDEAATMLTAVADDVERTLGATHPRLGTIVANLARVQAAKGDLEGARATYERALVVLSAGFGADHQVVATGHANLATTLRKLGRYDEAAVEIDRALAIERVRFGEQSPRIADNIHGRAQIALVRGRPAEALPDYRAALRMWQQTLGADDPRLAYALVGIGKAELAVGGSVDVAGLERALALRSSTPDVGADDLAETRFVLAQALRHAGREPERARELATQAKAAYLELHDDARVRAIEGWLAAAK